MLINFAIFLFLLSASSLADVTHRGQISHIDFARSPGELTLIYFDDGAVLKLPDDRNVEIQQYLRLWEKNIAIELVANTHREIISYKTTESVNAPILSSEYTQAYEPTVLNSAEEATTIFNSLRTGAASSSQCYNRAHVWAYESKQKYNLNSLKVFIFYTRKYIREYDFNWWFHVSPFALVNENGETTERVLDFKFSREPLPMQDWTEIFIIPQTVCPVITKYSDYADHQEEQYCYLYKESMYYLQPLDLKNLEIHGRKKEDWIQYEVRRAYRNAFNVW